MCQRGKSRGGNGVDPASKGFGLVTVWISGRVHEREYERGPESSFLFAGSAKRPNCKEAGTGGRKCHALMILWC
jgi:hypothetical protein